MIRKKSEENFNAGNLLKKESMFASSIHCFYYSCIQLMIYVLLEQLDMSERDIEQGPRQARTGFHNWIINLLSRDYFLRNRMNARKFRRQIYNIKEIRINADYKLNSISKDTCNKVKIKSLNIINMLIEDYQL